MQEDGFWRSPFYPTFRTVGGGLPPQVVREVCIMKKMSYILLLGFLCCVFGGVLCVLGYVRGGMEYVKAADVLPRAVVEKMEAAFAGKKGTVSEKGVASTDMEEGNILGDIPFKNGNGDKKYNFQLSKKQLHSFDAIQGNLKHVDLKIVPSDNKDAYMKYVLTAKKNSNPFQYQVKGSTLVLSEKEGMYNKSYVRTYQGKVVESRDTNLVTLYLPQSQLKSISLTLGEGDIFIKGLDTKMADVNTREGDVWLEASSIKGGTLKTKNGDIIFEDGSCGNSKFSTTNGDVDFTGVTMTESQLYTTNGDIILDKAAGGNCKITAGNGDVELEAMQMKDSVLATENGDVDLERSTITDCSVKSGSGDIFVEAATVSGKEICSDDGDLDFEGSLLKNCNAITDCGDITAEKLKVSGNVLLTADVGDVWVGLDDSCRTKINLRASTDKEASLDKSGKYTGKVKKIAGSRVYNRDTGSKTTLKIVSDEGDIVLE